MNFNSFFQVKMSDYPFPWGPPPPGYVPGLGRGATGFVSYIENAVVEIQDEKSLTANMSTKKIKEIEKADNEADDFYNSMDLLISSRNKAKKKVDKQKEKTVFDETRDQFADLTRDLKTISSNAWENIPERGQIKNYRPKWELLTYASGRMITGDFADSNLAKEDRIQDQINDAELEANKAMMTVSRAKNSVLNAQLSKISKQTTKIDTSKYLQEIDIETSNRIQQYDDLDHAAQLYRQMTHYNKNDPMAWITRARIEEKRGRYEKAAKVALDGLSANPDSEDLVLEASRLSIDDSESILEAAVQGNHKQNAKVWLQLASIQNSDLSKITVLERALQNCPESSMLWLAAADCDEDQRMDILKAGISMVKNKKDLLVSGFESSKTAEDVQFFASNIPQDSEEDMTNIYITQAIAEEKFELDFSVTVNKITTPKSKSDESKDEIKSKDWITIAMECEMKEAHGVASMIIKTADLDDDLLQRANEARRSNCNAVCESLLRKNAENGKGWTPFLEFERSIQNLDAAVQYALGYIKDGDEDAIVEISKFLDDEKSLDILHQVFATSPKSEKLAIAITERMAARNKDEAAKFAFSVSGEISSAKLFILATKIGTEQTVTPAMLKMGVTIFPKEPLLWIAFANMQKDENSRLTVLQTAAEKCQKSSIVHIEFARSCKRIGLESAKIRAIFERACDLCPTDETLWMFAAEIEEKKAFKKRILEKAKSVVKRPGVCWARSIELVKQEKRLTMTNVAISAVGEAREVLLVRALEFWRISKIDEAIRTFARIVELYPNWGDGFIFYLRFEMTMLRNPENLLDGINKLESGYVWEAQRANVEYAGLDDKALAKELAINLPDPLNPNISIFCGLFDL